MVVDALQESQPCSIERLKNLMRFKSSLQSICKNSVTAATEQGSIQLSHCWITNNSERRSCRMLPYLRCSMNLITGACLDITRTIWGTFSHKSYNVAIFFFFWHVFTQSKRMRPCRYH